MNTQAQGAIVEQKCFLKCIEYGWIVSKPLFDNARYDFLLDTGKKIYKIQVKTSRWNESHTGLRFNCYSQHSIKNGNKRMKYTNQEIDYFMTEFEGQFYLYPAPADGLTEKTLRLIEGNQTNISYARDYQIEEVSKNL